tara:strand:- start:1051 stop:2169 length:1119 start_codon:yes stop_codon:yes gene_type:complete
MAEFKVREVPSEDVKSKQEIEASLLKEHEEQQEESVEAATPVSNETSETPAEEAKEEVVSEVEKKEIEDADVLSYIKNRYNKDIASVDDLFVTKETNEELPEDVATFLKYKKETGRGIDDFVRLNRNFDGDDEDRVLEEYLRETQPHLDSEDIEFELDSKYSYDEEYDDEGEIRKRKIAKKQALAEAKKYFNSLKDKYKAPLESSGSGLSAEERENYKAYQEQLANSKTVLEQQEKKRDYFFKKTNELFDNNFEGFKFNVADKELVFKPGDADQLKKDQSSVDNFINRNLDENGLLKDAEKYHKSLAVAMNPEAFASFFYEQGKADAVGDISKESKNIDMRRAPETVNRGGFKVSSLNPSTGNRLVIRSNKK